MSPLTGLHHVGHVVHNIDLALSRYRQMGFDIPPATFPALPSPDQGTPHAVGAGNTHAHLPGASLEIATVLDQQQPNFDVVLNQLQIPAEALPHARRVIAETTDRLRGALQRFEGLHILAFATDDVDATAAALDAAGIKHSGAHRLQRQVDGGARSESVGYLELADPALTPEGRLAVAESGKAHDVHHRNGALALDEVILAVPRSQLMAHVHRYRGYLDRDPRPREHAHTFDLDGAALTIVPGPDLQQLLPGERATQAPSFVGFTVRVRDLAATTALLNQHDVPYRYLDESALAVPSRWALGSTVTFRAQARR